MPTVAAAIFWIALALLIWVYAIYPLLAAVVGRLRPFRPRPADRLSEAITVGIAVHDGAAQIAQRIADIFENAGPGRDLEIIVASDGSTDATAEVVRRLANNDPRIRLLELARVGQSAAQGRIFESSRTDIVVLTDIETRFVPGCLAALTAPLADWRIACVTGVLRWHYDERTHTARDEGLYWRYEQWVRAHESRAGWLTAGTGALLAVRSTVYWPAPAHASLDQMLPLYAAAAGLHTVVAEEAVGTDRGTASPAAQRLSRTRIATQGIEANLRMSVRIRPWRAPGALLAIWSHKILRWATPFLALAMVLAGIALAAFGSSVLFLAPALGSAAVLLLALLGSGFAKTIVNVNVAFAAAWVNVLLRRRVGAWESR